MGLFGRDRKALEEVCSVRVLDEIPVISSLSGSLYALLFPVEIRLHNILQVTKDYSFVCHFPSQKIKAKGFSCEAQDYFRAELVFYGYTFFERLKIFSLLDEKVRRSVSDREVLSFTDMYVHEKLSVTLPLEDRYGNLVDLSQHRKSS